MTADRLQRLAARRQALTAQSQALRSALLLEGVQVRESITLTQLAAAVARGISKHPGAVAAGIAVLLVVGPRRALRTAATAVTVWSVLRRAGAIATVLWSLLRRA
jgi:hypothetical protein